MTCNNSKCLPPEQVEFSIPAKQGESSKINKTAAVTAEGSNLGASAAKKTPGLSKDSSGLKNTHSSATVKAADQINQTVKVKSAAESSTNHERQSLWKIFLAGILGGFAALIMPCIFPMLPLTVSFFIKKNESKGSGISKALIYGLSIIVIYVLLGLLITVIFGADALNDLSTNGIFNLFFFLLLVVFAASFLGAFEIILPASWVNAADKQSDKGGVWGLFFMAATLALVSFSCTGPIIGTLLVEAASMGHYLAPAIGMFGFALALALPFTLFAMFPSWMKALPKSGNWFNTVKVVLGFLELALAMKFLSNVDLAYNWHWFDREVNLSLWIVIFGILGIYLLGKLKLPHENSIDHISVPRLFVAIITLAFTIYMIPGLWGAPLKAISAFLPPQQTQDFDLYTHQLGTAGQVQHPSRKYGDIFHAPFNLDAFFDYEEGMAYARQVKKPVMIDFTGHACVNCRQMEAAVWTNKEVFKRLNQDYVLIQLYVDDKTELPANEQIISTFSGKKIKTIGNKWSDFQASRYHSNSQPDYVLLDNKGKLLVPTRGADYNAAGFVKFLDSGLKAYSER
ncbi:MAG: cytochrome c biogenesis protein CcdA [Bacteroidota bacterium]|nr:cytochrome c biogenesis protein CcdA [Bacteroidota bacterium]